MGDVLSSKGIEILEYSIGEGGSAVVHKGRVTHSTSPEFPKKGTLVAVKEYKPSVLAIPNHRDRIRQEGKLGQMIDHANIVRVYGSYLPEADDEKCYLFMEWVEGKTLDRWGHSLRKNAAWDKVRSVCENILDGLSELHSRNILHRDVKPENVMVVDDTAKLMDIGVAQITDDNEHTLHTTVKDFVGSVRYASPQFIRGDEFAVEDDVYSLGATYLELLTGQRPYYEIERKPVLPFVALTGPPEVGRLRDNVPPAMKILIEGCVQGDRARRPTLDQVKDALRNEGQSPYIQREIQRKSTDRTAYVIVKMEKSGGGFYADLASDTPELESEYLVVRKDAPVDVPSLNAQVEPEMCIAKAKLLHVNQSLGHFTLIGKRWVEGGLSKGIMALAAQGRWEEYETKAPQVIPGDFVLKKPS